MTMRRNKSGIAPDPEVEGDAEAKVGRLYAALHKMKRSYIRAFVVLLQEVGDVLPVPRAVGRDQGVEVARLLRSGQGDRDTLRAALARSATAGEQGAVLAGFASGTVERRAPGKPVARGKHEFHIDDVKVTARPRECRIAGRTDFTRVPRERLERAVRAFNAALEG